MCYQTALSLVKADHSRWNNLTRKSLKHLPLTKKGFLAPNPVTLPFFCNKYEISAGRVRSRRTWLGAEKSHKYLKKWSQARIQWFLRYPTAWRHHKRIKNVYLQHFVGSLTLLGKWRKKSCDHTWHSAGVVCFTDGQVQLRYGHLYYQLIKSQKHRLLAHKWGKYIKIEISAKKVRWGGGRDRR